jgi:hypothetical protein
VHTENWPEKGKEKAIRKWREKKEERTIQRLKYRVRG